jgi:hypothetical protein
MKYFWIPALAILFALPAVAAPTKLAQQGRLLDGAGKALEGSHELVFFLYDAPTEGLELWTETIEPIFDRGYYSVTLGEAAPLDDMHFEGQSVWLELVVDGEILQPRQEIVSVPYALRATVAEHLEGGVVDALEISVDGEVVIDVDGNWIGPTTAVAWTDLLDVPADLADGDADTLGGLSCLSGDVAHWDDSLAVWYCDVDIDTDTQLTEAQVDAFVSNNNYSTGSHTIDINTTYAAGSGLVLSSGAFSLDTSGCAANEVLKRDISNSGWVCVADNDSGPGSPGLNSLIAQSVEAAGSNCSVGGLRVDSGLDDNADGTLQSGEIDQTGYVCGSSSASQATNGLGGFYTPNGVSEFVNAELSCESVHGAGNCCNDGCGTCNNRGFHQCGAPNCNGSVYWNYDNDNQSMSCGWVDPAEVLINLDGINWIQ